MKNVLTGPYAYILLSEVNYQIYQKLATKFLTFLIFSIISAIIVEAMKLFRQKSFKIKTL